jgi:hypothetical protein
MNDHGEALAVSDVAVIRQWPPIAVAQFRMLAFEPTIAIVGFARQRLSPGLKPIVILVG